MVSDLDVRRINKAVDGQLKARGFEWVPENPDFLVALYVTVQPRVRIRADDLGPDRRHWRSSGIYVDQYEEGTIVIDFVDARSRNLIWQGVATGVVNPRATPEEREQGINEAVEKIIEPFPPKSSPRN